MNDYLRNKAQGIIAILSEITEVNHCIIYGSLSTDVIEGFQFLTDIGFDEDTRIYDK